MAQVRPAEFELRGARAYPIRATGRLAFSYRPNQRLEAGARLWLLFDIRQGAGEPQCESAHEPNYFSAETAQYTPLCLSCYRARTLDLYPQVPEFLHVCEITFPKGLPETDELGLALGSEDGPWAYPVRPIGAFHFWLLQGSSGEWSFEPTGYKTYRAFRPEGATYDRLREALLSATAKFHGDYAPIPETALQPTPGILWGDLHGMAFNQRPLDDFYRYAREVAGLDFAAAMLFSYNTCVGDTWARVKEAAKRHTAQGAFVGVAGVEFGSPPDGSHRNVHFPEPTDVPPIFFEERPPALDPHLRERFHPETIFCHDLAEFYATVHRFGGVVSGHFHTLDYRRESLAEIWQKQSGSEHEEERVFRLLNRGLRLGVIAGSDTHDSAPGNPEPEPGCPQPAGLMAVLADEVTPSALWQAVRQRHVYATTGARIALRFASGAHLMGSVLPRDAMRAFQVHVRGTVVLDSVELIANGETVAELAPSGRDCQGDVSVVSAADRAPEWYLLRVKQSDGHRAWSSPIWFDG